MSTQPQKRPQGGNDDGAAPEAGAAVGTNAQAQKRPQGGNDDGAAPEAGAAVGTNAQAQKRAGELDSLLDEIDSVLESNAEEFVKGFVQKGGE